MALEFVKTYNRDRRVGQLASLIFKPQAKLWRPMIAVSTAAKREPSSSPWDKEEVDGAVGTSDVPIQADARDGGESLRMDAVVDRTG